MPKRVARWMILILLSCLGLSACEQKYQLKPLTTSLTPTFTSTPYTPTVPFQCTVTPVAPPTVVTELEPVGVGGSATGTNESCATRQELGTVSAGNSTVVLGNLSRSGNIAGAYDWANDDFDGYRFTAGTTGVYQLFLDCFSTGVDMNDFDLGLFDDVCPVPAQLISSASFSPVESISYAMNAGQSFTVVVVGFNGAPQSSYRLTINGP